MVLHGSYVGSDGDYFIMYSFMNSTSSLGEIPLC